MSRADRRKQEREHLKLEKWVNTLSPHQTQCINVLVADKVKEQLEDYMHRMSICVSAKIFDEFDTSVDENERIVTEIDFEIVDFLKWTNKVGKGWLSILKELDNNAKILIKKMLQEGAKQKDIIEAIKKEFNVPTAAANRGFKVTREEWLKEKEETKEYDPEVEDGAKYIFEEPGSGEEEERALMERVDLAEPGPEVVLDIEDKPVVATTKAIDSGFEVISRAETIKMELKGKYADYKYENSNGDIVVNVDTEEETLTFLSITDVDKYEFEEIEKFKARMREVKEVFRL